MARIVDSEPYPTFTQPELSRLHTLGTTHIHYLSVTSNSSVGMYQGTSGFLVPRDTPGLTVRRCNETIGGPLHEQR